MLLAILLLLAVLLLLDRFQLAKQSMGQFCIRPCIQIRWVGVDGVAKMIKRGRDSIDGFLHRIGLFAGPVVGRHGGGGILQFLQGLGVAGGSLVVHRSGGQFGVPERGGLSEGFGGGSQFAGAKSGDASVVRGRGLSRIGFFHRTPGGGRFHPGLSGHGILGGCDQRCDLRSRRGAIRKSAVDRRGRRGTGGRQGSGADEQAEDQK